MTPEELAGKTRAQLLELCRARGLKATAWKRDQMYQALTGSLPEPPAGKAPGKNALASQLERRREAAEDGAAAAKKAKEALAQRNGHCAATGCTCPSYQPVWRDAFGWECCHDCRHTRWAHSPDTAVAAS